MAPAGVNHNNASMTVSSILLAVFVVTSSLDTPLLAVELPRELSLWEKGSPEQETGHDVKEQVRSVQAQREAPKGPIVLQGDYGPVV